MERDTNTIIGDFNIQHSQCKTDEVGKKIRRQKIFGLPLGCRGKAYEYIPNSVYSDKRGYIFFSNTHSIVTKANPTAHYEKHIP